MGFMPSQFSQHGSLADLVGGASRRRNLQVWQAKVGAAPGKSSKVAKIEAPSVSASGLCCPSNELDSQADCEARYATAPGATPGGKQQAGAAPQNTAFYLGADPGLLDSGNKATILAVSEIFGGRDARSRLFMDLCPSLHVSYEQQSNKVVLIEDTDYFCEPQSAAMSGFMDDVFPEADACSPSADMCAERTCHQTATGMIPAPAVGPDAHSIFNSMHQQLMRKRGRTSTSTSKSFSRRSLSVPTNLQALGSAGNSASDAACCDHAACAMLPAAAEVGRDSAASMTLRRQKSFYNEDPATPSCITEAGFFQMPTDSFPAAPADAQQQQQPHVLRQQSRCSGMLPPSSIPSAVTPPLLRDSACDLELLSPSALCYHSPRHAPRHGVEASGAVGVEHYMAHGYMHNGAAALRQVIEIIPAPAEHCWDLSQPLTSASGSAMTEYDGNAYHHLPDPDAFTVKGHVDQWAASGMGRGIGISLGRGMGVDGPLIALDLDGDDLGGDDGFDLGHQMDLLHEAAGTRTYLQDPSRMTVRGCYM